MNILFLPLGTVYDDINNSGCIPHEQCYCTYKGEAYAPGAKFTSTCSSCTCTDGQWVCVSFSCPGTCSIEGGSHISTFDEKRFTFFGDCNYVLTKLCDSNDFTVLGEIRKCGLTDTETCLKGIAISLGGGQNIIAIKSSGSVFVNKIYTQLPFSAANVTIFKPSSFFIIAQRSDLQVVIQLVPIMQAYVNVEPAYKGLTCGLCGNFNNIQADDFKAASGVVEGTSAAFANTWKTQADCPNVKNIFENPCTLSIENEQYAQHWCGLLTATTGPFAKCHSTVNPDVYYVNCMFDSCNCENSEDCMCAALSTYVKACVAKGIQLNGWRADVCTKYTTTCPKTLTYSYIVDSCEPTCRSLSEPDIICNIKFVPVDGCTCEKGTYMDESGKCVPPTSCPCYYKGSVLHSGEVVHDNGVVCSCTRGKLNCIGAKPAPACKFPMVYFNCTNTTASVTGAECQKSCQTLDMGCYSTQCLSGCICPDNLVADGQGACIPAEECPCVHNENSHKPGEAIKVGCNTCTCKNRQWQCTNESCLATCTVYGDGHYISFDGKRYSFSGDCEYTLVQNYCGMNNSSQGGTFRVITENIPCGTTGTTCSKSIKVFMGNYELILSDGNYEVIQRIPGGEIPFTIRLMGIYLVADTDAGLTLMWDKKTSVFIKLSSNFKGQVCGLCGNFDGNGINDFTTRSQSVVGDVIEFGNSWKVSPTCPDTKGSKNPCTTNPYRASWAKKQCSIITSTVFASCHSQIEPNEYYDACVTDACACDTGGDCECFCTAVAAYAQKCNEAGICISWRTPSICPVFCDYYNPKEECEWHYKPCGAPCIKTCRNKSGNCSHELQGLEGCYPNCPDDKPYFNEENMKCVETCGCYDNTGKYYTPGSKIPSDKNCYSCECTLEGKINCTYDKHDCYCTYDGKTYPYQAVIYNTTDGIGGCMVATCGLNGKINRTVYECHVTTTPFVFTSSTPITTTAVPSTISQCVYEVCQWSQWYDVTYPDTGENDEDFDTFDNLRAEGYKICKAPKNVECRAKKYPNTPLNEIVQKVECNTTAGLICYNKDQYPMKCDNYQIKIYCCTFVPCDYKTPTTVSPTETASTVAETIPPETTTTFIHSTATAQPTSTKYKTTTLSTSTMTTTSLSTTSVTEPITMTSSILPTTGTKPITTISSTISPCTKEICKWSQWYNIHYPMHEINDGDFETLKNIKAKGYSICETPKNVKCRAVRFPNTSLKDLNQNVTCSKTEGLICHNRDQFQHICLDYEIQIECCKKEMTQCQTTLQTKPVVIHTRTTTVPIKHQVTQKQTTTIATTMPPLPHTSTTVTTATQSTTHLSTQPTHSKMTPTTTSTTTPATACEQICMWSKWFDVDFPTAGSSDGDFETYQNIRAAGEKICGQPINIECRAENFPNISIHNVGQNVSCDINFGLVCKNEEQVRKFKICFNYQVRVKCCEPNPNCSSPTTTPETTTGSTPPTTTVISTTTVTVPRRTTARETASTPTTMAASTKTIISIQSTMKTLPHTSTTVTPVTQPTTHFSTHPTYSSSTPTTTTQVPSTSTKGTTASPSTVGPSTPVPSPTTTTATTICDPICTWGKWLDVDFPSSGPGDGDFETYHNFRAAGVLICGQPKDIECRAENFPNVSIENIGQVLQCDVSLGLVCKNEDQAGKFSMCFNYQVRVRCCEENPKCPRTTTIPGTTAVSTPSTSVISRTTPSVCYCHVWERYYQPGEVIYNTTDSDGCVFYAICTSNCSVSRFQEWCNTSTPATTPPATTITPTVTASTIITPHTGCQKVKPHRKNGETWNLSNCTIAKCENDTVVVENRYCPPAREITCANGYPPVLVTDETGCCRHYECQCTCSGWGDPHYITFDGTYYTFLQNCTYVLVKQIIPVYDNFRVYIDNYFCDAQGGLSCPKAIIVLYNSSKIVMTRETGSGVQANKIYFNEKLVEPGFKHDVILIATRGIQMITEIPQIGAIITFNGYIFSIQLPYSKFGNNTEGQCGTCTNNKSDECRLPDGQIISSCPKMAYHWKVSGNQTCLTPPPIITTPPRVSHINETCKVILSKVFEECHKVIPPEPFYKGCVFDGSHMRKSAILCSSLELYAFWCANRGVCIDWRNETNGTCPFTCPVDTVYKPCGPLNPPTCDSRAVQLSGLGPTEGCFCPEGKTLLNPDSDICVPGCFCVGPHGESKAPGTTWESDCQDCFCDNSTVKVYCEPRKCPKVSPVSCDKAGYVPVETWTKDDKCCPHTECRCNISFCPESIKKCEIGYDPYLEPLEGGCCSVLRCTTTPGCVLNGSVHTPGTSWYLPGNNCTSYECKENNGHYFIVTRNKTCVALNPEDCGPEGVKLSEDGCCKVCASPPKGCKLQNTTTIIKQSECTATVPIELTYCEGNCPASSIYSAEANMMEHTCKCCQEVKTSKKHVTLQCRNGTSIDYSYIHVDECGCVGSQCIPQSSHTTPAQVQEQQQQEQIQQQQWQG
ncbi:PREDICTED: mucin-5AC [Crocodylus porosus]|uniref:mucin-5AC n=1 Tax=Crocodylus porosus TaxID=8502 RepID=UPI00093DA723|nr:PREDICTED: mucin-5AC [Crocodylus porosus]